MTETKRRIKALKQQLPHTKAKVVAMATSLLLAVVMLTSVSFAWYSLSSSPEVSSIKTQVAANGNLEIALAGRYDDDGNLLEPLSSGIGDSFAAQGQTKGNLTWGNLINLSGAYGIEHLVLRPATLDLAGSNAFLSSKIYNEDGRVEDDLLDFGFTVYDIKDKDAGTKDFMYKANRYYGVRAISSVTYPDGKGELEIKMGQLDAKRQKVMNEYQRIYTNEQYIGTIQSIVQTYLDANVDNVLNDVPMSSVDCTGFVPDLYAMMLDFNQNAICAYGDVLAYMATIQTGVEHTRVSLRTLDYGGATPDNKADDKTPNDPSDDIALVGLKEYLALEDSINEALNGKVDKNGNKTQGLADLTAIANNNGIVYWDDIESILFAVIGIDTVTVKGFTVSDLTSMGTLDLGLEIIGWPNINNHKGKLEDVAVSSQIPIVMNSGAFWAFERQCGAYMKAFIKFHVEASVSFVSLDNDYCGTMRTSANDYDEWGEIYYKGDYELTKSAGGNVKPSNKVAADTYGMVLDLWVRTNAVNSILTLDGLAKYTEHPVRRVAQIIEYDEQGNSKTVAKDVFFYTVETTQPTGETTPSGEPEMETVTTEYLVYQDTIIDKTDLDGDENVTETLTVYRGVSTRAIAHIQETNEETGETTERLVTGDDVEEKYDIEIQVEGFESSNRVDENYEGMLMEGELSPTQGSGSCYIFYANNPDEAANTLKMLSYLKLAFVDANNNLLAEAKLNVDYVYADAGKYTVPIIITYSKCEYTGVDGANKETTFYGITELKQNEATLISVVVYLEGAGVDNSMVLSGETVSGSLNIQFASTQDLNAMFNTDLSLKYLSLSALIDGKSEANLQYTGTAQGLKLTAAVEGISGGRVEAIFQRMINATQGSKQETIILDHKGGTAYEATAYFTVPGTYVLKTLWIDGTEYELPNQLMVVVDGFAVTSATINGSTTIMTSDNSVTRQLFVSFGRGIQPKTVSARFTREIVGADGKITYEYVTQPMTATGNSWSGNFTFKNSGTYKLTDLILDREYYDVPESFQTTLVAYLGMYTEVTLKAPADLEGLEEDSSGNIDFLCRGPVNMMVEAKIFTKEGQAQEGLQNVVLAYANQNYANVEDGTGTELTWNSSKACYEGTMPIGEPGYYYYAMVKIAASSEEGASYETLTSAQKKPSVTAISPEPPTVENVDKGQTIITQGQSNAQFSVTINSAPSAQNVYAIMSDGSELKVNNTTNGKFYFRFPDAGDNSQSGEYTVTALKFYNVYADGERYYRDEANGIDKPYIIDIVDETYKVMDKLNITTNSMSVSGSFMQQHSLITQIGTDDKGNPKYTGITVTPKAPETDAAIPDSFKYQDLVEITEMTVVLKQVLDSNEAKGGYSYTRSDATAKYETLTLTLTDTNGDGIFEVTSDKSVQLAGYYTYEITVKVTEKGGTKTGEYVYKGNSQAYLLTVNSATPTVTIYSASPNKSHKSIKNENDKPVSKDVVSKIEGNTATVYCESYTQKGSWGTTNYYITTYPQVTLQVNMGEAERVEMKFGDGVQLYESARTKQTDYFVWTDGNDKCTRYIGYYQDGACGSGATITGAGTIESSSITLIYNGISFTANVATIKIVNPH